MTDAYEQQDRDRLAPAKQKVLEAMLEQGWYDADTIAKRTGLRVGTVLSKLRELCDSQHVFLGLAYERRRLKGGVHEYRLFHREPGQMPLFDTVAA